MTVFNQFHYQKNTKNQQGKNSRIVDPIKLIEWNGVYCTVDSITPMKPVGIFAEGIFLSDVILQWGFFIRGDRLIGLPLKVLPIIEIWMLKRISIAGKTSGIWWMKGTATKLTRTNLLLIGFPLKNKISTSLSSLKISKIVAKTQNTVTFCLLIAQLKAKTNKKNCCGFTHVLLTWKYHPI